MRRYTSKTPEFCQVRRECAVKTPQMDVIPRVWDVQYGKPNPCRRHATPQVTAYLLEPARFVGYRAGAVGRGLEYLGTERLACKSRVRLA